MPRSTPVPPKPDVERCAVCHAPSTSRKLHAELDTGLSWMPYPGEIVAVDVKCHVKLNKSDAKLCHICFHRTLKRIAELHLDAYEANQARK